MNSQIPQIGQIIRTTKPEMEGEVEKLSENGQRVFFRISDGRLMETSIRNTTVIEKLEDADIDLMEISNELLTKYKTAAGKECSTADKKGDTATGNKRFKGIIQATKKQFVNDAKPKNEGIMGGINRCDTQTSLSHQHDLDRNPESEHSKVIGEEDLNELSIEKLKHYRDAAQNQDNIRTQPLRKLAKHLQGATDVNNKIRSRLGYTNGPAKTFEERLEEFINKLD